MLPEKKKQIDACLKGIAKGDARRVDDLYDLVEAKLFFIALKYMGDRDKAEDLMADFWCDIARIARRYIISVNPFSYLCKVLTNMALTRLRKEGRAARREVPITPELLERYESTFVCDVFRTEYERNLREAVGKGFSFLTEKEKIVVYLTFWEEKTIRECAAAMSVSRSTAERLKEAATAKLKEVLEKEGWSGTDRECETVFDRAMAETGGSDNG